ncbi:MAG TPA: VOC family protein [Solirubrobacterales bacterium]|nr:VOC family protein [Solirubrobacterales bacterium]
MANNIGWFEVAGKDQPALRSFYGELFDWSFNDVEGMPYALVDGANIGGGIGGTPDGSPGHVTFYVEVDDLEGALKQVESLGGSHAMGPMEVPGGTRIAHFTDPEGHLIGLMGD